MASTRITASVLSSSKTFSIVYIVASVPHWSHVAVCRGPATSWTSPFNTQPLTFPTIRTITLPAPIDLTPGVLFNGIIRQVTCASNEFRSTILDVNFFAKIAIYSVRSFFSFLYFGLVRCVEIDLRLYTKGHMLPLLNKLL